MLQKNQGLFFEEFKIGQEFISQSRTVTESDIINFASFTGDWAEIHTSKTFAEKSPFGQRIAHGMLSLSIASGLSVLTGAINETVIAFDSIEGWKFLRPVFINDTIQVKLIVAKKQIRKLMNSVQAGQITLGVTIINQKSKKIQAGNWIFLVKMKNEKY